VLTAFLDGADHLKMIVFSSIIENGLISSDMATPLGHQALGHDKVKVKKAANFCFFTFFCLIYLLP